LPCLPDVVLRAKDARASVTLLGVSQALRHLNPVRLPHGAKVHAMVSDDDVTGPQLVRDRHSNFHPSFGSNLSLSLDCAPSRATEPHHSDGGADEQDLSHSDRDDIIAVGNAPIDQCGEHQHGG
jgi:hypothetical protein